MMYKCSVLLLLTLTIATDSSSSDDTGLTRCSKVYSLIKTLEEKLDNLTTYIRAIEHNLNITDSPTNPSPTGSHPFNITYSTAYPSSLNITDSTTYPSSSLEHSCEEIKANWPDSPSDYYIIADSNGHARHVYCYMEELCDSNGGWMRVAYLNMSDSTEKCPPGFRLYNQNGVRACGRPQSSPVRYCQSVKFPSYSISYSQVCGRVTGYQYGSPDGIDPNRESKQINNLNGAYIDGVSLTHGNPRQHIWTFMAGLQEHSFEINGQSECPCAPNSPVTPQSFVGNDYFCESGNSAPWQRKLYPDPLWDGKQCGLIEKPCCLAPGIPWFHKTFDLPTTDYIELRVCGDQDVFDEDIPVGFYEIYVK